MKPLIKQSHNYLPYSTLSLTHWSISPKRNFKSENSSYFLRHSWNLRETLIISIYTTLTSLDFYLLSTLLRGQFGNKFSAVLMNWPSEARSIWINQGKFCRIDRAKGYLAVYYLAKILLRINNIASHFKITKQIRITCNTNYFVNKAVQWLLNSGHFGD